MGEVKNAMKLLITAGHNWWVVMPNFVVQEPTLGKKPEQQMFRGPIVVPEHVRMQRKMGRQMG